MAAKVTFNASTRRIEVTQTPDANGVINLNVKVDLYSDGKEDWLATPALQKARFPIEPKGGDTLPVGVLGDSYILVNGWKIQPYEADHTLIIEGNLFPEAEPLVVDSVGAYRIDVTRQVSTLVEVRIDDTQSADMSLMRKILDNRFHTDPVTGKAILYDDDGVTPIREWDIYEDVAATQPYRSQGTERRDPPSVI
jgi:hypothetical protein